MRHPDDIAPEEIERLRTAMLKRMSAAGTAPRPNHEWLGVEYSEYGSVHVNECKKCPHRSPYRTDRGAHRFIIDEELL